MNCREYKEAWEVLSVIELEKKKEEVNRHYHDCPACKSWYDSLLAKLIRNSHKKREAGR